ncbi:MAG: hypothetical protein AAF622_16740 [Cyanobacteria bacterium P01_C01_bin.147]
MAHLCSPFRMARHPRSRLWILAGLLVALLLSLPRPAIANMANPERPGDLLTEPWTDVANLEIQHEDLVLDLRPVETTLLADIQATYTINNPGEATTVALLFVAPGLATGTVTLDGTQVIAATQTDAPDVPADWGNRNFRQALQGLQFEVLLSPGEHAIAVAYQGVPSSDDGDFYRQYTLEYWLAPARQWQAFGTLTVDVFAPVGWVTTLTPDLPAVASEHWQNTFEGLPANALTVTTHPVVPPFVSFLRVVLPVIGIAIAFALTFWLYRWLGQLSQRQDWSGGWLVLTFLLVIPLSIPLFWAVGGTGIWAAEALLKSAHLGVGYSYSRVILLAMGGLVAVPTGLLVAIFSFVMGRVSRRKRQPAIAPKLE